MKQSSHLEANHQLQNARQWQSWIDMHDCHPQLDGSSDHRSGGHLAACESKGVKEIEFCDQSQDLSVFHRWERIEFVLFEQRS
jgi:hypothetical protein